jgi:positive regulator of sigma E activity
LAVGFTLVRWHGIYHRQDPEFQPVLLRIDSSVVEAVTIL